MRRARLLLALALAGGLGLAALLVPLGAPLERAWLCYRRYASRPPAEAEVRHKLERGMLAVRMRSGRHAGTGCIVHPAPALYERLERGATLEVVYLPERPGACETVATVERSGRLLYAVTGGVGALALALLGGAAWAYRSLSRRAAPRPHGAADRDAVA